MAITITRVIATEFLVMWPSKHLEGLKIRITAASKKLQTDDFVKIDRSFRTDFITV